MAIYLKNACYIDPVSLEFNKTNILVETGLDAGIRFYDDSHGQIFEQDLEVIDCKGKLVTHSFAVGHHHAYSALARGMPAPSKSPGNFVEVLKYIWWQIDESLDADMIEASALATAMACAKAGASFIIDHHASPNFIKGSLDIIARSFEKVGVSHLLCYEITDRGGNEKAVLGLEESETFLEKTQALVGLHASFTLEDHTLKQAIDIMHRTNSGIHIHVAEDLADQAHCEEKFNKRVVQRLEDAGALESSKTILVHCLHLNEEERSILSKKPVYIAQNMESNLNNNVGKFNSTGLNDRIMLGTDGMHSDMLRSAQSAFFAGQGTDQIDYEKTYQRFRRVHDYIQVNGFKGDGENNLVVLDYDSPTEINRENFLGHFIYGFRESHIIHTISNGELILKDCRLTKVNEDELLRFTKEQSLRLWDKLNERNTR